MKFYDFSYRLAWTVFYILAMIVCWNSLADNDWRFLSEMNRKLLAIVGLCLYILLVLERRHRPD